jgi:hypothetical protein
VDVNHDADTVQGLNMYDVRRKCDKSKDKDGPVSQFESERFATGEPMDLVAWPDLSAGSWHLADLVALLQGDGLDGDLPEQARGEEAYVNAIPTTRACRKRL